MKALKIRNKEDREQEDNLNRKNKKRFMKIILKTRGRMNLRKINIIVKLKS
jgi:hypothetical protein